MKFPVFWFVGFLNHMGWPQTKGLFIRKKVISSIVFWDSLDELVKCGITLGALRPKIAVNLIADLFSETDWSLHTATELWTKLDASEQVAQDSNSRPEEVIKGTSLLVFYKNKPYDKVMKDILEWESIFTNESIAHLHYAFVLGLVWGLSHPEETLVRDEKQRQKFLKYLPDAISAGLDVHSPETLEEFAASMEEAVNEYQKEIRPLCNIPKELLSLPVIAARLNAV